MRRFVRRLGVPSDPRPDRVAGAIGRVTGRIAEGDIGEVVVPTPRGTETFFAHPYFPGESFAPGEAVRVVEMLPPRTVRVVRA